MSLKRSIQSYLKERYSPAFRDGFWLGMGKILCLPLWLQVKSIYPFLPKTHIWKKRGKMYTLEEWALNCTPAAVWISAFYWMVANLLLILAVSLMR